MFSPLSFKAVEKVRTLGAFNVLRWCKAQPQQLQELLYETVPIG